MSSARRGGVDNVVLLSGGAGNPQVFAGTADPTVGGGFAAPEGSIYMGYNGAGSGQVWTKRGASNTDWQIMGGNFGGLYVDNGGTAQNNITGTPVKMTGFASAYGTAQGIIEDIANDQLVLPATSPSAGLYLTMFQCSFDGQINTTFEFSLYDNFGNPQAGHRCRRKLGVGGDIGSCSFLGVGGYVQGQSFEIRVESDDGGGASFTPRWAQFYMLQLK
ncbi:MAG: hypothetical protein KJO40_13435 [Deltaproteobacteria bacterium]|nr:hypothetical protein [Deltaproteobacteria bacterium]